jgi:hypothetical protein
MVIDGVEGGQDGVMGGGKDDPQDWLVLIFSG